MPQLVEEQEYSFENVAFDTHVEGAVNDMNQEPWGKYKGIYNQDAEQVAIVGKKYTMIPHKDVFKWTQEVLEVMGYNISENSKVVFTEQQKKMFIHVDLGQSFETGLPLGPDEVARTEGAQVGDVIAMGLLIRNAIDGSMGLAVDVAMKRLVCSNGMWMWQPDQAHGYRRKHCGIIEEGLFKEAIAESISFFERLPDLFRTANETELDYNEIVTLVDSVCRLPQVYQDIVLQRCANREQNNAWVVYNDMTYAFSRKSEMRHISHDRMLKLHKEANKVLFAAFNGGLGLIIRDVMLEEDKLKEIDARAQGHKIKLPEIVIEGAGTPVESSESSEGASVSPEEPKPVEELKEPVSERTEALIKTFIGGGLLSKNLSEMFDTMSEDEGKEYVDGAFETTKALYRVDPREVGLRHRGFGFENERLYVSARDPGIGEFDVDAMKSPNFINFEIDEGDPTYCVYWFQKNEGEAPASPSPSKDDPEGEDQDGDLGDDLEELFEDEEEEDDADDALPLEDDPDSPGYPPEDDPDYRPPEKVSSRSEQPEIYAKAVEENLKEAPQEKDNEPVKEDKPEPKVMPVTYFVELFKKALSTEPQVATEVRLKVYDAFAKEHDRAILQDERLNMTAAFSYIIDEGIALETEGRTARGDPALVYTLNAEKDEKVRFKAPDRVTEPKPAQFDEEDEPELKEVRVDEDGAPADDKSEENAEINKQIEAKVPQAKREDVKAAIVEELSKNPLKSEMLFQRVIPRFDNGDTWADSDTFGEALTELEKEKKITFHRDYEMWSSGDFVPTVHKTRYGLGKRELGCVELQVYMMRVLHRDGPQDEVDLAHAVEKEMYKKDYFIPDDFGTCLCQLTDKGYLKTMEHTIIYEITPLGCQIYRNTESSRARNHTLYDDKGNRLSKPTPDAEVSEKEPKDIQKEGEKDTDAEKQSARDHLVKPGTVVVDLKEAEAKRQKEYEDRKELANSFVTGKEMVEGKIDPDNPVRKEIIGEPPEPILQDAKPTTPVDPDSNGITNEKQEEPKKKMPNPWGN